MRTLSDEARKRKMAYDIAYKDKYVKKRVIDFNIGSDEDKRILNHLDAQPNKAKYVKRLISEDMIKAGK